MANLRERLRVLSTKKDISGKEMARLVEHIQRQIDQQSSTTGTTKVRRNKEI